MRAYPLLAPLRHADGYRARRIGFSVLIDNLMLAEACCDLAENCPRFEPKLTSL